MEDALAPRLRLAGDTGSLTKFGDFLSGRTMEKGTDIILLYRPEGVLELAILPPGSSEYTQASSTLEKKEQQLSKRPRGHSPAVSGRCAGQTHTRRKRGGKKAFLLHHMHVTLLEPRTDNW